MALPKAKLPRRELEFDGEKTVVRGLTRGEGAKVAKASNEDPEGTDALVVSYGCDVSRAEANEWLEAAPLSAAILVIETILELSGLGEKAPKG